MCEDYFGVQFTERKNIYMYVRARVCVYVYIYKCNINSYRKII